MAKNELTRAMKKKADDIAKATETAIQNIADWQQLKLFFKNRLEDIQLTATQQEKLQRYNTIYSEMQGNLYSDTELPWLISKKFNIGIDQAYKDIAATRELYSSVIRLDKMFEVRLRIDHNKALMRKAEEMNDLDAFAKLDKNLQKYLAMLPEEESGPGDDFMVPQINAVFDPELLGRPVDFDLQVFLKTLNEKRQAKISKELFEDAEIVEEEKDDAV